MKLLSRESRTIQAPRWCTNGGDTVRQTTSRRGLKVTGTRERWRKKIKREAGWKKGHEGTRPGYLFCGGKRNYFMGVESGDAFSWKETGKALALRVSTLIGKGASRHLLSRSSQLERPTAIYPLFFVTAAILLSRVSFFYSIAPLCSF